MAFAFTETRFLHGAIGNALHLVYGTFTNGASDTGGDITMPFATVAAAGISLSDAGDTTTPKVVLGASKITITTLAGSDGDYWAMGY